MSQTERGHAVTRARSFIVDLWAGFGQATPGLPSIGATLTVAFAILEVAHAIKEAGQEISSELATIAVQLRGSR